jgi:progressive ankylosis protein
MQHHQTEAYSNPGRLIVKTWMPLAASWLLMGLERPIVSAFIARLAAPEIHLAAFASAVFPLSLIIESPIIMLLAASTALSKDWAWYCFLRNFMARLAVVLTLIHMIVAFTPVFDFLVTSILQIPEPIVEPARIGMMMMTPWTASIAVRRFYQGILIRFGQSRWVGIGTAIRLCALIAGLTLGIEMEAPSGIVIGTFAISLGVLSEAAFVRLYAQPILNNLKQMPQTITASPNFRKFLQFYLPLATTPLLTLLALPIASAALSRMPSPIESFAVWPILGGLVFLFQGIGLAYQEVVVALIEKPTHLQPLRRFALQLATGNSMMLSLIATTPLASLWFITMSGLSLELATLGNTTLFLAVFLPALTVISSWLQGILVHFHETKRIIEAVAVYLIVCTIILGYGIYLGTVTGIYMGYIATLGGLTMQTIWLRFRCHQFLKPDG